MRHTSSSVAFLAALTALAASCKDSSAPERPGAPTDIAISAGNAQTGAAGGVLAAPLAAKVTDAKGRGVPNVEVTFQALVSSGTVTPTATRTNGAGIATTSCTLPTHTGGTPRVRAVLVDTLTGALVDSVSFGVTVLGGAPVTIYPGAAPSLAAAGTAAPRLEVLLLDEYGNRSPNATVTWSVTSGGGSVNPASSITDLTGIAGTIFTLGAARGTNRVTAAVGTLATTFTIEGRVPGEPEAIVSNSYQPVGPLGGTVPLSVTVYDGLGAPVPATSVAWAVTGGGGTVSPAASNTNSTGVATTQLTLGSTLGLNTVEAKHGNLTASFIVDGRNLAPRLTNTDGSAFGIARTNGGRFVVSLIHDRAVETFAEGSPDAKQLITTGGTPVAVAVDAAGALAYVSNMDGWLDILDLGTNALVGQVAVAHAHSLALSPAGDRVYVTRTDGFVIPISTATRTTLGSISVPNGPWGIAFRTSGTDSLMYVTARDGGSITEIDTKTMTVLRSFNLGGRPHGLVISPDGSTLYAADNFTGSVKAVSTATGEVTTSVALPGAFGIAISPDGSTLYVTTDNATAAVVATSTLTITKLYETGASGRQVVATPDGSTAYAANEGGWVDILRR